MQTTRRLQVFKRVSLPQWGKALEFFGSLLWIGLSKLPGVVLGRAGLRDLLVKNTKGKARAGETD